MAVYALRARNRMSRAYQPSSNLLGTWPNHLQYVCIVLCCLISIKHFSTDNNTVGNTWSYRLWNLCTLNTNNILMQINMSHDNMQWRQYYSAKWQNHNTIVQVQSVWGDRLYDLQTVPLVHAFCLWATASLACAALDYVGVEQCCVAQLCEGTDTEQYPWFTSPGTLFLPLAAPPVHVYVPPNREYAP